MHIVTVILESKAGKEALLKSELEKVAELSVKEDSCVEYHIHQDNTHPAKFALYEKWVSPEEHQKQFQKPYILEFAGKAEELLAKPYQVVMSSS